METDDGRAMKKKTRCEDESKMCKKAKVLNEPP